MKNIEGLILLVTHVLTLSGQVTITRTDRFSVEQNGKTVLVVALDHLNGLVVRSIGDVKMFNSKGEEKSIRKNVKGVLLRDALKKMTFEVANTKELNQYIFVLEATDGYKVVLSRNEVFNSENLYIVSESNDIPIHQSSDRIEVLAISQPGKGHIYIKGLKTMKAIKIE